MEFRKEKQQHTLCEDKILCDEVLFKHRKPYDKTVPQRGGDKDFSPDDSWLQAKRLEKFYEERRTVLAEPRVDRLGSIVTGEWNPEIQLVELHKEMGKFWSSMGFSDKSRKWLYPEEALFLMETNTLEVWYKGLPVSIQQAYAEFLKSLNFEEYMVYAHLRRIGYVVLRHQGRLLSTKYERKIKLDKHINLKRRKMMSMKQPTTSISDKNLGSVPTKKVKLESDASPFENCSTTMQVDMEREDIPQLSEENGKFLAQSKNQSNSSDCLKKDKNNRNEYDKCINEMGSKNIHPSDGGTCLKNDYKLEAYSSKEGKNFNSTEYSVWNFKDIVFPDVGDPLNVQFGGRVSQNYFPQGIPPFSEKRVDKELVVKLRAKGQKNQRTGVKYGQEVDSFDLLFSYEQPHPAKKIRASNWREYKEKLMEFQESQSFISPVEHYWRDDVVPLVRPEDAINTISVLKKLQVIPQWEGNPGSLCKTEENQGLFKVSYDVFKPDAKFRKSNPGVPDHRVCVMRSEEDPPSLSNLTSLYSYYDDDIPIHWAVVDNGEIAFYSFGQISFPTQVFMG